MVSDVLFCSCLYYRKTWVQNSRFESTIRVISIKITFNWFIDCQSILLVARSCMAWCSDFKWPCWVAPGFICNSKGEVFSWWLLAWLSSCSLCSKTYHTVLLLDRNYIPLWLVLFLLTLPFLLDDFILWCY
jgi:hypothetical protein